VQGALIGDPLDLKMFSATGWKLEEPPGTPPPQRERERERERMGALTL